MSARPERKKMCWNCEGNVNLNAENCPYCQSALYPQGEDSEKPIKQEYPSPYKPPRTDHSMSQSFAPSSPFTGKIAQEDSEENEHSEENDEISDIRHVSDTKNVVVTMGMLMGGLVFFIFGLLLLLYSSNGYLVLRWSNAYWFFYAGIGALMIFLGFYNLKNIDENE
ncbi:MAG: hypothetical protein H0U49_09450 [Parachlamydiaceae bacterium]|nr:hypothetical protein [Parachlamydiaceae bacterium]